MRFDPAGTTCSGKAQQGTKYLRAWCMKRWHLIHDGGIYACRPVRGGSTLSLHGEGRAWDAFLSALVPAQRQQGDELAEWAVANAGPVGVQEVIWNRRRWDARTEKWSAYRGQSPHTDHVHIGQTWLGARFLTPVELDATISQEDPFDMIFKDQGDAHRWFVRHAFLTLLLREPSPKDMTERTKQIAEKGADWVWAEIADSTEGQKVREKQRTRLGL